MKRVVNMWRLLKSPVRSVSSLLLFLLLCLRVDSCPLKCDCQRTDEGHIVDCSSKSLTSWPAGIPRDTVELDLSLNFLSTLGFHTAEDETFPVLKKLVLKYNSIDMLYSNFFKYFPKVEHLDLDGNMIMDIEAGSFSNLANLQYLHLENNEITTLKPSVFNNLTLNVLNLERNNLQSIQPSAFHGSSIIKLHMDYNNLLEISQTLLSPLQFTLKELHISHNTRALQIAKETFQGFDLDILSLCYNQITNSSFLSALETKKLDLSGNLISTSMLGSYQTMNSVEELSLKNNSIDVLNPDHLQHFTNLKALDLSNNKISFLLKNVFEKNSKLETLNLNHNMMWLFPEDLGATCPNLEILMLEGNSIISVSSEAFANLRLAELDLSFNKFQVFEESLKDIFNKIPVLSLTNNPLYCNCEMKWFRSWLEERTFYTGTHNCHTSKGEVSIYSLALEQFVCRPPQLLFKTPDVVVDEGSNVLLSCTAEGDPAPEIVLSDPFSEGISISPQKNRTKTKTYAMWQLKYIPASKAGYYTCTATNVVGSVVGFICVSVKSTTSEDGMEACKSQPTSTVTSTTPSTTTTEITTSSSSSTSSTTSSTATSSSSTPSVKETTSSASTVLSSSSPVTPTKTVIDQLSNSARLAIIIGLIAVMVIAIVVVVFLVRCALRRRVIGRYTVSKQADDILEYHKMTGSPPQENKQSCNGAAMV